MGLMDAFFTRFQNGDSWIFLVLILIVSVLVCYAMAYKRNIISDWAFEPIVGVPKSLQNNPVVREWFTMTRGQNYVTKLSKDQSALTLINAPIKPINTDTFFSGWAFTHALQHFIIAFMCPKLAPISILIGVGWEVIESINHSHCALDIFWNTCGCLLGLLLRFILFPETK